MVKTTCPQCREVFEVYPSRFKRMRKPHCSMLCYAKTQSARKMGKNNPNWGKRKFRENNPNWKGGTRLQGKGYTWVLKHEHPAADAYGYVSRARFVMEEHIGRYLQKGEIVHHIDEDKQNDNIGNLMLLKNLGEHVTLHNKKRGLSIKVVYID